MHLAGTLILAISFYRVSSLHTRYRRWSLPLKGHGLQLKLITKTFTDLIAKHLSPLFIAWLV